MMDGIHTAIAVTVLLGVLAVLKRVIVGPTLMDRILAVNVIGTKTIVLLALVGFLSNRPGFFLDIALAYALINFIATIAILKFLETRAKGPDGSGDGGDA
jgi:multicomponent Na+:H+ antiporter subunit F